MKKLSLIIMAIAAFQITSCNTSSGSNEETKAPDVEPVKTEIVQSDDPSQQDVVQVAVGSTDHTTLVSAIKAADLVEPLHKSGPYTVFAPTNEAFDKLPSGTLDDLLRPEKKDVLADILEYHVSVGVFTEDMMSNGQRIGQVNSQNITISKVNGKIRVNDKANIIGTVRASNGIIYVIDEVLLPPQ